MKTRTKVILAVLALEVPLLGASLYGAMNADLGDCIRTKYEEYQRVRENMFQPQ